MISGVVSLSKLFSIFHDGCIVGHASQGSSLTLDVEIQYLADLINPDYTSFRLIMRAVDGLLFRTWPNDADAEGEQLTSASLIFAPELEILNASSEGDALKIMCNQSSGEWNYCGGELLLKVDSASVFDQGGREYSIDELEFICERYWSDWKTRNLKA